MSEATAVSTVQNAWIMRVLGVDVTNASVEPPDLRGRLNEIGIALRNLPKTPETAALVARFTSAVNAMKSHDWTSAAAVLDEIEPAIRQGLSQGRAGTPKTSEGEISLASVAKASLSWRTLCATTRSDIDALKGEALSALEASGFYDADEIAEARAELVRLDKIFTVISPGICDEFDGAVSAAPAARKPLLRKIADDIAAVEAKITGHDAIADVEQSGLRKIDIAAPALAQLRAFREALAPHLAG